MFSLVVVWRRCSQYSHFARWTSFFHLLASSFAAIVTAPLHHRDLAFFPLICDYFRSASSSIVHTIFCDGPGFDRGMRSLVAILTDSYNVSVACS